MRSDVKQSLGARAFVSLIHLGDCKAKLPLLVQLVMSSLERKPKQLQDLVPKEIVGFRS